MQANDEVLHYKLDIKWRQCLVVLRDCAADQSANGKAGCSSQCCGRHDLTRVTTAPSIRIAQAARKVRRC